MSDPEEKNGIGVAWSRRAREPGKVKTSVEKLSPKKRDTRWSELFFGGAFLDTKRRQNVCKTSAKRHRKGSAKKRDTRWSELSFGGAFLEAKRRQDVSAKSRNC